MAKIIFKGTVHPTVVELTTMNLPDIHFSEPPYVPDLPQGLKIDYKISIEKSCIEISCEVEPWDVSKLDWVMNRVAMTIRALIDLYGFGTGTSLVVTLDSYIGPDGNEKKLLIRNPKLQPICTVMSLAGNSVAFGKSLELVITEPSLALALRDLISGVTYPNTAVIDCARAVEGIRHLMDANIGKRGTGWTVLQEALNIERTYREFITTTSTNPRHGDKSYISGDVVNEVVIRSWTIMNRYIELRLRKVPKLPLSEFPLLT